MLKELLNNIILINTINIINIKPNFIPSKKPFFLTIDALKKFKIKNMIILEMNNIIDVIPLFTPNKFNKLIINVNINSEIKNILINFK